MLYCYCASLCGTKGGNHANSNKTNESTAPVADYTPVKIPIRSSSTQMYMMVPPNAIPGAKMRVPSPSGGSVSNILSICTPIVALMPYPCCYYCDIL